MILLAFTLSSLLVNPGVPITTAGDPLLPIPPEDAPGKKTEEAPSDDSPRPLLSVVGGTWIPQGPGPILNGQVENVNPDNEVAGAIHTVAAHPDDPDILYIGAVNGGIWRTANATAVSPAWSPQTDAFSSLSIGALEFDPDDPNTLIAGIGRFSSFSLIGGDLSGLLGTTDGGENWTQINDPLLTGENISGVAIRSNVLLASSNGNFGIGGLFRSADGGNSWTAMSGANGLPAGGILDLVGDPTDPNRFYASVAATGIYRSDDGGLTWNDISSADAALNNIVTSPANNNTEMAAASNGRIYAAAMIDGQAFYVGLTDDQGAAWTQMDLPLTFAEFAQPIVDATNTSPIVITSEMPHGLFSGAFVAIRGVTGNDAANGEFFISVVPSPVPGEETQFELNGSTGDGAYTGGGTWTRIVGLNPKPKPGGQGARHFSIVADPDDPDIVYVGGDRQDFPFPNFIGANDFTGRLFRGDTNVSPAGTVPSPQWEHLTHSNAITAIPGGGTVESSAPHADSREMVFDAEGDLIQVDDGGIYRRTSPGSNIGDWFSLNGNIQVTEFHDIAYDTVSNIIIGGAQDTGTPQQITSGGTTWDSISTADGGDVAVDDTSLAGMSIRYSSRQILSGFLARTYDASNNLISEVFPSLTVVGGGAPLIPQFVTPVELNAIDPARLIIGGGNSTYESLDQGNTITEAGPGIGANADAVAYGGRQDGEDNPGVLYIGSDSSVFIRTTAAPDPLVASPTYAGGFVQDIVLDPGDYRPAYVIDSNQVFQTNDAGATWTDVTGNLVDSDLRSIEFASSNTDAVFVGGRSGVFLMLTNTPGVWFEFGSGLPEAPVLDLDFDSADSVLVAGTLGRGAWLILIANPTVSIINPADGSIFNSGAEILFEGTAADSQGADLNGSLIWTSNLQPGSFTGESFSTNLLVDGVHIMTASVTDASGNTGSESITVTVSNTPPIVTINDPLDGATFTSGTIIDFSGAAIDPEDGDISASLVWTSNLHPGVSIAGPNHSTKPRDGFHEITATVTDSLGNTASDSITITVGPPPSSQGRIVFVSNRDSNEEIYLMNPDGSGVIRCTTNISDEYVSRLSPDGTKIAFGSDRDGNNEIYVMGYLHWWRL